MATDPRDVLVLLLMRRRLVGPSRRAAARMVRPIFFRFFFDSRVWSLA